MPAHKKSAHFFASDCFLIFIIAFVFMGFTLSKTSFYPKTKNLLFRQTGCHRSFRALDPMSLRRLLSQT
jgi:hypothetical protein